MKKYILGAVLALGILAVPASTLAAGLTNTQIQSILSLLSAFGADSATITNVNAALNGTPTTGGIQTWCHTFNKNLGVGSRGEEVYDLELVLGDEGITYFAMNAGSPEMEQNNKLQAVYDETTASAATVFQEKYARDILIPNGLQHGTGYVGAATRAKLNSLYGCNNTTTPTAQSSITGESGNDVNGVHIGYIKSISSQNGVNSMTIDYVQWLTCSSNEDCPNGYKVVNSNTQLRAFTISSNVQVKLQTYSHDTTGNFDYNQKVTLPVFTNAINNPTVVYPAENLLYWITLSNGVVTNIAEQYQP